MWYFNSLDGTEDCLLWKDKNDSDESQNDWDSYGNPYICR